MQFKASQRLRNPNEENLNFDKSAATLAIPQPNRPPVAPSREQANRLPTTAGQDILQQPHLKINESVNTTEPPQPNLPPTSVDDILQQPVHRATGDSTSVFEKMSKNVAEKQRDEAGDYVVCDDEDDGIDNEDTIAEDELHELDEDNDLEALQAEAEMDIEELRKRYYGGILGANQGENAGSSDTARDEEEEDETSEEGEEISSELVQFMNTENGDVQGYGSDDDDDEYAPKIYKPPRVGPEYQHLNIPVVDSTYKAVHDHADVLWKPTPKLNDQQLDQYQESVIEYSQDMDASKLPSLQNDPVQPRMDRPIPFWDSEEALYTLMQNDYDPVKSKKAFAEGPPDVNLPRKTHFGICLPWEEDDLLKFETGLHVYLKKFNKIQQEYLPGRSIGEVIHFYYRWKKTERFDLWRHQHQQAYVFAQDLQSNSTDIMENIIELIDRDDVPAAEANVLVAEAQSITAKIHGQPPP
uniref:SANT domain-containing protein n=1 Tax=Panagrolaimus superbus TaxID=310955 RepID=A0A914YIQ5_9BILA